MQTLNLQNSLQNDPIERKLVCVEKRSSITDPNILLIDQGGNYEVIRV